MSLVGPRPTCYQVYDYQLWQTERLEVLPGLTGLWQVNGRNEIDLDDKVRMDIQYIRQASLWTDVRILFRTIPVVLTNRGAS
jgi:lipopolysaccharide/colanic/teichoic acid biosynthesis glycosyltransferase